MTPPSPAADPAVAPAPPTLETERRNGVVLWVLTIATFIVILNETIMVNAIPDLMRVFDVTAPAAQWLSTAFMLTMAVVIPTTGWLLQRLGTRRGFALAMTLFCAGTLLAALAPTFAVLLLARVVQASGTAIMMPLLMSTVMNLVSEEHRGRVMGNVSLAISVAPALGPAISGLILGFASWRWLFGLVFPLALAMAIVGVRLLQRDETEHPGHLDLLSVVLTVVGFGGLVYGLSQIGEGGDHLVPGLVALALGVAGVSVFAWRQRRLVAARRDALLDLRVLRSRVYTVAVATMACSFMALMGAMILLPMFLQEVRQLSTLQAGLVLMPGGIVMGVLGPVVGRIYDRVGARALVVPGAAGVALGLAIMAWSTTSAPWWMFLVAHVVMSVSLAFVFTPVFAFGLGQLPPHLYEHGSAFLGTIQQVAAGAGTALVVTVMTLHSTFLANGGATPVASLSGGVGWGLGVAAGLGLIACALALLLPRHDPAAVVHDEETHLEPTPAH